MGEASSLVQLGFSEHFRAAYENHPAAGSDTRPGRVCIEHRGRLVVLTGGERLLAWPPEGARHESLNPEDVLARPRVGDWVVLPVDDPEPRILGVLPRRTALLRQTPKKRVTVQVVAANLDRVLVVSAWGSDLSPRRVERFVAAIQASGARPELVINKMDLADRAPGDAQALFGSLAEGLPVWWTSAHTGAGLDALRASIEVGETLGLVGTSVQDSQQQQHHHPPDASGWNGFPHSCQADHGRSDGKDFRKGFGLFIGSKAVSGTRDSNSAARGR